MKPEGRFSRETQDRPAASDRRDRIGHASPHDGDRAIRRQDPGRLLEATREEGRSPRVPLLWPTQVGFWLRTDAHTRAATDRSKHG